MYIVVAFHNNGVYGDEGFSDYEVESREEVLDLISEFFADGIAVYRWDVWESGNPFDE